MSPPDSASPSPPSSRSRRWLVGLLVASMAVNLLIVGAAFSGWIWPEHGERGGFHRSFDLLPRQFFAELDQQRRAELAAVFRARKTEFREQHRALRDAAAALADALEREPYDPPLAQSAIAEHSGRSHQLIDLGATTAATLVETLTPEERRALAEAIRQRLEQDRARRSSRSRQ
jgi:Spy/CpxP family protein refolding chaperone